MSQLLVSKYLREIGAIGQYGGSMDESSIRKAFSNLLDAYCRPHDLRLIDELEYITQAGAKVYPDGTLKDALRLTHGYWEAKDEDDDLDEEIAKKRAKGYPTDNILYEDSVTAILIQNGAEIMRAPMRVDPEALDILITAFVSFQRPEVRDFRLAIDKFKDDMPKVLDALRQMIDDQLEANKHFHISINTFLKLCKNSINQSITLEDVREMLIQHVLTEDIFLRIFEDSQFHRENNVARELQRVAETFFTGAVKRNVLRGLESYYGAIRQAAAGIADHHEKQNFLKAIYENFYKVYNPDLADRLGVVYTPTEIVRFMIDAAETLLHRHFSRLLSSKNVEILDPAVGTGTFITDIIEHLKGNKETLRYKYLEEIHCNEVAILPYYIANLNIEFTYAQLAGEYREFPHICFVDTLDNLGFAKTYTHQQHGLDFGMTVENTDRIAKQNKRKISVIIGNPPYNANQINENDDNKNRIYEGIDKRIRETWIEASGAQKTKMYDMYARFFRWAADRINADGVIAFITNRSFIDSRTFDGFRSEMCKEFNEVHIVDLGGDVRGNPKLSGTVHNVFGIQTGVAISFWVKRHKQVGCRIFYTRRPEMETAVDKLAWLSETPFSQVEFEPVTPDDKSNWINLTDNDFDSLLPLTSKETKSADSAAKERAVFKLYSLGVVTNRDEWVYDDNRDRLREKIEHLISAYNEDVTRYGGKGAVSQQDLDHGIKWTRAVKSHLAKGIRYQFDESLIQEANYRPFVKRWLYYSRHLNEMQYQMPSVFPSVGCENLAITTIGEATDKPFSVLATDRLPDLHFLSNAAGTQCLPYYRFDDAGNRTENITDWALNRFKKRYGKAVKISKWAIFHYTYAVLHDPVYRETYAQNLKRGLPRIPFYENFEKWSSWGKALMDMHVAYENAVPWPFKRDDLAEVNSPKVKLRCDKELGTITLDEATTLSGIPPGAWEYKLGNRSAIEWVMDQYKESKPRDPAIRESFNTYRFADYKEAVIPLLARVCRVSVETQLIIAAMKSEPR